MEMYKIIYFFLLNVFGIFCYLSYYKKTRDILNMSVIIVIWCFTAGIANMNFSWIEDDWNTMTYLVVTLFPITVSVALNTGRMDFIEKTDFLPLSFSNCYTVLSRFLFLFCVFCSFVEFEEQGFTFTLLNSTSVADSKELVEVLHGWHYGTIMLPYFSILFFYELCFSTNRKKGNLLFLIIALIFPVFQCVFVLSSRGTLIIIALGIIYILTRKYRIKFSRVEFFICFIIMSVLWIGQKRIFNGSLIYNTIEGKPLFSAIYSYSMLNFNNLNTLTEQGPGWFIAWRSFGGLLQLLGIYNLIELPQKYSTLFFNATPIVYDFYDDMGVIGVLVYTFVIYFIIKVIYRKMNINQNYVVLYAALQKAIWVPFFGNYFCEYRVTLFPYLVIAIMVLLMDCRIINGKLKVNIRNIVAKNE